MARSKDNIVIHGMTGKLGDILVFRNLHGQTIASKAPNPSEREPTGKQQAVREKFQRAAIFGKMVNADPNLKQEYQAAAPRGQSAYNVAVADFFNAPDILEVDVSGYSGVPGQQIKVKVTDDFKVKAVVVTIQDQDGTMVEEGPAVQVTDTADWVYTTTADNEDVSSDKITITATDNPANLTKKEQLLP